MVYPSAWKCPNCKKIVANNKVCPNCRFKYSLHYPNLWQCPECNTLVYNSESCEKCNYPNELHYPGLWHCSRCEKLVHNSTKCSSCGYESREQPKDKVSSILIQKKLSKYKNLLTNRRNLLLASMGLITILGIMLIISVPAMPQYSLDVEALTVNEGNDLVFTTTLSAQNVDFSITSPNGLVYEYTGSQESPGKWVVNNASFNESGDWSVIVQINSFGSRVEFLKSLKILPKCVSNSDCDEGVCCFGACVKVCSRDADCDDGNVYTSGVCVLPDTCSAYCIHKEPLCFSNIKDGYCPSHCNRETDADCENCPSNKILCGSTCYKPCYKNSDCDDGDSSTFDECIVSANPCNSYCTYTYFSDIECPAGKIRVGGSCITPKCFTDDDCDDGRENYAHKCLNKGTEDAYCYHEYCSSSEVVCKVGGVNACVKPVCSNNNACSDGTPNAFFYCMNPNSCDAYCNKTCISGFKLYNNECVKACASLHDCAVYEGKGLSSCFNSCADEDCIRDCYNATDLTLSCDYTNGVCRTFECVNNAGCNDNNPCTLDVCRNYKCYNEYLGEFTRVNNNLNICCNGSPKFYCNNNERCNEPNFYYNFSSPVPILSYNLPHAQLSLGDSYYSNVLAVNLLSNNPAGSGVFFNIGCVQDSPFLVYADILTTRGTITMNYSANNFDEEGYSIAITNGWSAWQTYSINGTMNCSKDNKLLRITSNDAGPLRFYIDNLTVLIGQSVPMACDNSNPCNAVCNPVNQCINNDGLCPAGCFFNNDNNCTVCEAPEVYCNDYMGTGCRTPACYTNDDCSSGSFCEKPGTCLAECFTPISS